MAKRHESLVPIARDHHEGLILAVRLQQGTGALLKLWSHDPKLQMQHVAAFYDQHLKNHFTVEEQALFPLVRQHVVDGPAMVDLLLEQHRALEQYIPGFRDGTHPGDLKAFGALLEKHIRYEDRTVFPAFESAAPPDVLAKADQAIAPYYPDSASG